MDIQTIWIIVAAVSTPIAGVVGFAIQLRQVNKARLENEKLRLEIARLQREEESRNRRIILPTNREVERITRPDELPRFRTSFPEEYERRPVRSSAPRLIVRLVLGVICLGIVAAALWLLLGW